MQLLPDVFFQSGNALAETIKSRLLVIAAAHVACAAPAAPDTSALGSRRENSLIAEAAMDKIGIGIGLRPKPIRYKSAGNRAVEVRLPE